MSLTYLLLNVICFILFSVIMAETEIANFLATSNTVKNKRLLALDSKYGTSRNKRDLPNVNESGDNVVADEVEKLEKEKVKSMRTVRFKKEVTTVDPTWVRLKGALSKMIRKLDKDEKMKREAGKGGTKRENDPAWGKWTNWAPCSVTCGRGRKIRWRNCVKNCDVETEMEEKRCQLPACPNKLFGIFKL